MRQASGKVDSMSTSQHQRGSEPLLSLSAAADQKFSRRSRLRSCRAKIIDIGTPSYCCCPPSQNERIHVDTAANVISIMMNHTDAAFTLGAPQVRVVGHSENVKSHCMRMCGAIDGFGGTADAETWSTVR